MIVQPFIFGNVGGDLDAEFAELDQWTATVLGQSDLPFIEGDHALLASVARAHIYGDSQLFHDGYHLQTLLNMIDSSYPFVFFILGDTYGNPYVDSHHGKGERNMQKSISLGHTWLLDSKIRRSSLLNILIHYAASKNISHIQDNGEEGDDGKPSPFIYIRRPSYEHSIFLMSDNGRFAHQRAPAVLADALRLDELKRNILMDDLRMRFFDNSTQMIDLVFKDLRRCVTRLIKQPDFTMTPTMQQLMDDLSARVNFYNSSNARDGQPVGKIIALVGESRSGKHRMLSAWLSSFSESNPGIPVSVFRGDANAAIFEMNCVAFLMNSAIKTFRRFYNGFDRTFKDGRVLECVEAKQLHQVEQEFAASLEMGPCLLVVMGLDNISNGRLFGNGSEVQVKQLKWLPEVLPPHCRIIVTTKSNDMTLKTLLNRRDTDVIDMSSLAHDKHFKKEYLHHETVAFSKFPPSLLATVLSSPASDSSMHLGAISRLLANHDMLSRLEYQVECLLEIARLRDLFNHEVRKWTNNFTKSPQQSIQEDGEHDQSGAWIPTFLRFLVLSRYGMPIRYILPTIRFAMGIKKHGSNNKIVEKWMTFWLASKYIFKSGPRNTLNIASESVRRSLSTVLFDAGANSFRIWRRRFVRFLQHLPNSYQDPVVIDELIMQAEQSDDYPAVMRLLSDGNCFMRLVTGERMEVFALSLLVRIELNTSGMFRYMVARWMNSLGLIAENVINGDSTDRSNATDEIDSVKLPDGPLKRCEFAWLITDILFAVTRLTPEATGSDGSVTIAAFSNLVPLVTKFCEKELAKVPFDAEARARYGGFLERCAARFTAPRFNTLRLAVETMNQAAHQFKLVDQELTANGLTSSSLSGDVENLGLIETLESNRTSDFHQKVRYSYVYTQLESCEIRFKLGDTEAVKEEFSAVEKYIESLGNVTWPPVVSRRLFCLSLFSQSSVNAEQCEKFLRSAADVVTKWYGRKHPAVADTFLALGCILASRATTPKLERIMDQGRSFSRPRTRPSTGIDGLRQVIETLFTSEEVEQCFREAIAILDERRLSGSGDTERLSFACASLGRFLSNLPTSSAKREAAELLQKAADLALLEKSVEDYTVRWLRNIAKDTLLAMPPPWFTELQRQQEVASLAEGMFTRPSSSRSRLISATAFTFSQTPNRRSRPITSCPTPTAETFHFTPITKRPATAKKIRPKTSLGLTSV